MKKFSTWSRRSCGQDQKQYEFPAWINHDWSVHVNKDGGEGEGERELINFSPLKRGGLLERGGGVLIENLCYINISLFQSLFSTLEAKFKALPCLISVSWRLPTTRYHIREVNWTISLLQLWVFEMLYFTWPFCFFKLIEWP